MDNQRLFLNYCRLELGLSDHTISNYGHDLQHITEACVDLSFEMSDCGPDEVARVLAWLRDNRQLQAASLSRHLVSWRMYQRYLVLEGVISRDRVQLARSPKLWNTLPEVLTVDEVTKLLLSAPEGKYYWRDRCALSCSMLVGPAPQRRLVSVSQICARAASWSS